MNEPRFLKYSSFGTYPLVYVTERNQGLCHECAKERFELEGEKTDAHPNCEEPIYCDDCGQEIEAAYS